jgi:uncharacterized protein (TIGR02588 family)
MMTSMTTSKIAKHPLEWIVFAVSLVLVAGTLGFLAWDAIRGEDSPAALSVEIGRPEPRGGAWAVPVTVHNRGDMTAESVKVEVTLETPGAEPERADFEAAFVPRRSKREGWVTFRSDPSRGKLSGRAAGYSTP